LDTDSDEKESKKNAWMGDSADIHATKSSQKLTCIDRFVMRKYMKKICFVFNVSEVPDFNCLIHGCCGQ